MVENNELSGLKVIIVAHTCATGVSHALRDFLQDKVGSLVFISHPFPFSPTPNSSVVVYEKGRIVCKINAPAIKAPDIFLYIKDVLFTIIFVLRLRKRFDVYFGADSLFAAIGIFLHKIGLVKKVIFYPSDYVPRRFENRILNKLYHWMDKFSTLHCDYTWNPSPAMIEEREREGILKKGTASQFVVPVGTNFEKIKRLHLDKVNRHHIAFVGVLRRVPGLELVLDTLPEVIQAVPDVRLVIIGGGSFLEVLRQRVKEGGLEKYVTFTGFIEDHRKVENILARCAIGLAPYVPTPDNFAQYTDPGKPKLYAASGLPVIITRVPRVADELERARAGLVIDYSREELAQAMIKLLTNDGLYRKYRKNAIRFASRYTWDKIFEEALSKSL